LRREEKRREDREEKRREEKRREEKRSKRDFDKVVVVLEEWIKCLSVMTEVGIERRKRDGETAGGLWRGFWRENPNDDGMQIVWEKIADCGRSDNLLHLAKVGERNVDSKRFEAL